MCYHASTPSKAKLMEELPQYTVNYDGDQFFHVSSFTRPFLPVTTKENFRTVEAAQWKLLPFWVKTEEEAKKYANTCNAESESIFEKASYKSYIGKHRGLLWVDGFYEPHKVKGQKDTENYFIFLPEKRIFSIGIVVAPWTNQETGEIINTFSVLIKEFMVPYNGLLQAHKIATRVTADRTGNTNRPDIQNAAELF